MLRQIPMKRRFAKLYPVVRNLVFNPRSPLDLSLGLMKHLLVQDLKNLSGNKEVSDTVRKLALKNFKAKTGNRQEVELMNLTCKISVAMSATQTDAIAELLKRSKTIAVVGLSNSPLRPSHGVSAYMQTHGYRIIPVNPQIKGSLGEKSYASLLDVRGED